MQKILQELQRIEQEAATSRQPLLTRQQITAAIDAMVAGERQSVYDVLTPGKYDRKKAEAIRRLVEDEEFNQVLDNGGVTFGMIKPQPHLAHPDNHGKGEDAIAGEIMRSIRPPLGILASAHTHIPLPQSQTFYSNLVGLGDGSIYRRVTNFMSGGAVTGLILSDNDSNAVSLWRQQIGSTRPADAAPGTLRNRFAVNVENNVVHGSDSIASARAEIKQFSDWLFQGN